MTSDAKIGLLLGLFFIFVIAFIINGLPSLRGDENNNELTTNMVNFQNEPPGLGARERKAQEVIERIEPIRKQAFDKVQTTVKEEPSTRFEMLLPKSTSVVKDVLTEKSVDDVKSATDRKSPQTYVVSESDNLAVIAKKCYGPEEGNKKKNITKIFEANRKLLKSPDEIYVGQKLIIPALSASLDKGVFRTMIFEKVKSIGRKRPLPKGLKAKLGGEYVVQEGDSLWRIAAEQLGDGSRYSEISELNADILEDEDSLDVGMRLRLPGR